MSNVKLRSAENQTSFPDIDNLNTAIVGCLGLFALLGALYSVHHLEPPSKITVGHGLALFSLGLIFFTSLYTFLVRCARYTQKGQHLTKKYKFSVGDVLDICTKIVSCTQALMSCLTGYWICTHSCCKDLLRTSHYISSAYTWFGAAYFFYDIWSMYRVHVNTPPGLVIDTPSSQCPVPPSIGDPSTGITKFLRYIRLNPLIVGHHLFIGLFGFSIIVFLRGDLGDCVFGFIFLMEASTPFVSLRSVLVRFGVAKSHKVYIWNGFLMVFVFFLCRVVMFPYVIHLYARTVHLTYFEAVKSLPTGCKISISILMFPQLYWFYLMVKGAMKIMSGSSGAKTVAEREMNLIVGDEIRRSD